MEQNFGLQKLMGLPHLQNTEGQTYRRNDEIGLMKTGTRNHGRWFKTRQLMAQRVNRRPLSSMRVS
jgi:hypothetical protein